MDKAVRLHGLAVSEAGRGHYKQALRAVLRALGIIERTEGKRHPDAANVLNTLGQVYINLAEYSRAGKAFQRSVSIMKGLDGHRDLVRLRIQSWNNLGTLHRIRAKYQKAETQFKKALREAEEKLPGDDPDLASTLNNLAVLYKYTGKFDSAENLYRRALAILKKIRNPLELAALYHNLGGLEHSRGRFAKGEPFARKSVVLREEALGQGHPDVAADMAALAGLLDGQGKFKEAKSLYARSLTIFRRVFGDEHYEIAVTLNNLAALHAQEGKFALAQRQYKRAIQIKTKLLGANHPDVAVSRHNLGVLLVSLGKAEQGKAVLRRALKAFERELGSTHPKSISCRQNLTSS